MHVANQRFVESSFSRRTTKYYGVVMSIGRLSCVVLMLAISSTRPAIAQPQPIECSYETAGGPSDVPSVSLSGEYRALVVFVKFSDDASSSRGWPDTLAVPPPFADSLIASSPNPGSYPGGVFPEHTITRYFRPSMTTTIVTTPALFSTVDLAT